MRHHSAGAPAFDNLGSHKTKAARQLIRAAGAAAALRNKCLSLAKTCSLGRNHLRHNRRNPPSIYAHRMCQLFPKLRLCPIL